jgi:hypothetical protein
VRVSRLNSRRPHAEYDNGLAALATDSTVHPARRLRRLRAGTGDILVGGAGNDLFQGDDDFTVLDFRAGAGAGDRIDLSAVAGIDDFGDALVSAHGFSGGLFLDFGSDEITLLGVNVGQLNADDFLI